MGNFFKHAPARDTYQKRFLEALGTQDHVVASFPLGYPAVSLYAFSAMVGSGLVIAICSGSRQIRRNLEYFKAAGFQFPDVAFLDGTQMPHEERAIRQEINHHRVRLLCTTPERFLSLTFLEILVHADIRFMVVEEADRFLPSSPGHNLYRRFQEEGLESLNQLPQMVFMIPPLAPVRLRELVTKLRLPSFQSIACDPLLDSVSVMVKPLMTEHQKFMYLVDALMGGQGLGKLGRLDSTGAVLIQTAFPAQAEKLGASLIDYGFESVWITHYKKSPQEQAQVLDVANTRLNAIIVNAGSDVRAWMPPSEAAPRLVYWMPPASVDELVMQLFRQLPAMKPGYGESHFMKALILYTKEDFEVTLQRLRHNRALEFAEMHDRVLALKHYRRWILSDECRLQSLVSYYQGSSTIDLPPCGQCDRCIERHQAEAGRKKPFFQKWLKPWLY